MAPAPRRRRKSHGRSVVDQGRRERENGEGEVSKLSNEDIARKSVGSFVRSRDVGFVARAVCVCMNRSPDLLYGAKNDM